jgi:hypothetical protein
MAFPVNPTNGQEYNDGTYTYRYNSFLRTWTKVAQTTSNVGNVITQSGTVSTPTIAVTNVAVSNLTSNTVTVGDTSITSNTVTVGETTITQNTVTVGETSITPNTVTVGQTTVTNTSVTVGETSITTNTVSVGQTTVANDSVTVGETSITTNTVTVGQTTVATDSVTVGNTSVTTESVSAPTLSGNLVSGTTSIVPSQNGDVAITVGGVSNVVVVTSEGAAFSGNANVSGTLFTGHILPTSNITYDIGSTVNRFNDVYSETITLGIYKILTTKIESNSNNPYNIDSFPSSEFRTIKYIVQSTSIEGMHSTELFCMQDGVETFITEYATLISGTALANFSLVINGSNVNLVMTPLNPHNNIITTKVVRYAVTS